MTHPINYWVSSHGTDELQRRYGSHLQEMPFRSLLTFNAVVAVYGLYYFEETANGNMEETFTLAVKAVSPKWHSTDSEAYEYCKAFLLEEVDGCYVAVNQLYQMCEALGSAIQSHFDY